MTGDEAREIVVGALHQTARSFNNPAVSQRLQDPGGDMELVELDLDSLDMVEWSVEIEKQSGVALDTADLAGATHLSDVVKLIVAKKAAIA